jgi:hypothetical protein
MVEQEVVIQVVLRLMHQLIKVEVVEVLEDQMIVVVMVDQELLL